jgi:hypothetical protein
MIHRSILCARACEAAISRAALARRF